MQTTIANTYGAALVGCIVSACLYGITCVQTCLYIMSFPDDLRAFKTVVKTLWVLDTLHLSCVISTMYFFLVTSRTNLDPGTSTVWTDGALIITSNISDILVRIIFLVRIYHLSGRSALLLTALGGLALAAAGFGIFYGVVTVSVPPSILAKTLTFTVYTGLASSAAADIAISATLCWLFCRMAHEVETAHPLIYKLLLFAIQAGVLPSFVALSSLITYAIYPHTFMYMGIFFVLPKATLNSMLAMLNARKNLRQVLSTAKLAEIRLPVETPELP